MGSSKIFSFTDHIETLVLRWRVGGGAEFNLIPDFPREQREVGRVAGGLLLGAGVSGGRVLHPGNRQACCCQRSQGQASEGA